MDIEVKESSVHGRGVFAKRDFNEGELIEDCPVIVFSKEELEEIDKTVFYDYYFAWEKNKGAIALGLGSLYNHSYAPNAVYLKDFKNNRITFKSIRPIESGEEIFTNYNGDPSLQEKVWFDKS